MSHYASVDKREPCKIRGSRETNNGVEGSWVKGYVSRVN